MNDADANLGDMTLADIEAVAARLDGAARTIRSALSLLGPSSLALPGAPPDVVGPIVSYQGTAPEALPHLTEARRKREEYLREIRQSAARQEKLAQFAHDGEAPIGEDA